MRALVALIATLVVGYGLILAAPWLIPFVVGVVVGAIGHAWWERF